MRSAMQGNDDVMLIDTTLREGQQHGRVSFDAEQALRLARLLDACRVQMIEVGHPAVSDRDRRTAEALCGAGLSAALLAHARVKPADVRLAASTGASWVGLFAGVNDAAVAHKFRASRRDVLSSIDDVIREAKSFGLRVRFTCEDASRTPYELVEEVFHRARRAGADRLSYADTVGRMTPGAMRRTMARLVQEFGGVMHAHCHNDFGLATANALSAYEGGAVGLDVSVDGIGERAGIAPLAEVACALTSLYRQTGPWKLSGLPALSEALREMTRDGCADPRPIVGRYAFTHKAGLHVAPTLSQGDMYEPFDPSQVGRRRRFVFSRMLGASALAEWLRQSGAQADEAFIDELVSRLKASDTSVEIEEDGMERILSLLADLPAQPIG